MGTKEYHAQKSREHYARARLEEGWLERKRLYQTERRNRKKSEAVQSFGGSCNQCGKVYPDCVFEFHHIDHMTKEYNPSHLFALSDSIIRQELEKCIMLCANCHRIEHHNKGYDAHEKRKI